MEESSEKPVNEQGVNILEVPAPSDDQASSITQVKSEHHSPWQRLRQQLNVLIHPSGKHIHVVQHPHEVEPKREEIHKSTAGKAEFDVVVYSTPEHLSTIRDIQNHNLRRREALRTKNEELFKEFDEVHETLDVLSAELGRLTTRAVALDASFGQYGYSAHIRTTDDNETGSLHSTEEGLRQGPSSAEARHKDRSMEPIRFFKTPTIRQYFHKGLLWRSSRSGEVGTFELFTDLIYVGVIDYVGEAAVTHASAESFLHFVIVFSLAYKIWSDLTITVNWFEVEDCVGRLAILFVLCCLYGFNSCVEYFFETTYVAGLSFYLTQRVFMVCVSVIAGFLVPMVRGALFSTALIGLMACALYIGAAHVEYPYNVAVLFPALVVDYCGGMLLIAFVKLVRDHAESSPTCKKLNKAFEFVPAMNIEHRVERTSAFTTLVFGYSILKSLYQSHAHVGVNSFLGKGMLSVIQAFALMWIYFDIDGAAIHVHAIRRHWMSSSIWVMVHLPLSAAFILASSTLGDLVLAHDTEGSNPEDLAETYANRSVAELELPLRWFYCGGLAATLLCMTIIGFTHIHKKVTRPRISKTARMGIRLSIAVIITCLPLAHDLSSLELIGISTSLIVFVLIFDIFGNSCPGERFWTGGYGNCPQSRCKYVAKVKIGRRKRAALEQKILKGEDVKLEDALKRTESVDSLTTLDVGEEWYMGHA